MNGFGPQVMTEMLAVNKDTFRYWREHLDPNPHRAKFSSVDLFVYQLIKFLIYKQEEPVRTLEACGATELFVTFTEIPLDTMTDRMLYIDVDVKRIELLEPGEVPHRFGFGIHYLPLKPVFDEYLRSLINYGVNRRN